MSVEQSNFLMIESIGGSSALSNLSYVVVDLSFFASLLLDEFDVASLRLEDTTDGEEPLNIISSDQLLASEDINEVESLGKHHLRLSVDNTDDWVVSGLHKLRRLDEDSDLVLVSLINLFKGFDHLLVHGSLLVDKVQDDRELRVLLPDLSWLDFGVFLLFRHFKLCKYY